MAESSSVSPTYKEVFDLLIEIDVANRLFTVIVQAALKSLPSLVVAVIVAIPGDIAVTNPVDETVATLGLLELHIRYLFEAHSGIIVVLSWNVSSV